MSGIEPPSQPWQGRILTIVLHLHVLIITKIRSDCNKKGEKMKNKNKKIVFISIILILVIVMSVMVGCTFLKEKPLEEPKNTVEVVDKIETFGYQLEDRDTEVYKNTFNKLKDVLANSEVDYEEYARFLTKLFLIDLYTIDNKISKYDVGALDFIYETEKEKFKNKLLDTMYKLVLDNSNHERKQELPIVKDVKINKLENTKYKKGTIEVTGFKVNAQIQYEKDLGYDKNVDVTIIKEENKLYVVNLKAL